MMEPWMLIAICYTIGVMILLAELFLPSHGVLLVLGLGFLGYGLVQAFSTSTTAGIISAIVMMIGLPMGFVTGIRYWHRTPIGRRISPPNPTLTEQDRLPVLDLPSVGAVGVTVGMLRPVGTCEFNGRHVECKAEYGVIEAGVTVEAIGLSDRTIVVRQVRTA